MYSILSRLVDNKDITSQTFPLYPFIVKEGDWTTQRIKKKKIDAKRTDSDF